MNFQKYIALLLTVCALLSLTACGAETVETVAPETETAAAAAETIQATEPDNSALILELMDSYLNREDTGRENVTTHFGINAAHNGVPAEYIEDICVNDRDQFCITTQIPWPAVICEAPEREEQMRQDIPADVVIPAWETVLKAPQDVTYDPERVQEARSDFIALSDQGVYHEVFYLWGQGGEPKLNGYVPYGADHSSGCAFTWMPRQNEAAVLRDMLSQTELFTLDEKSFDKRPCLTVSWEMPSSSLRLFHYDMIKNVFGRVTDMLGTEYDPFTSDFNPYESAYFHLTEAPARVTAYFDRVTHACLGRTVDATESARVLQEKLLKFPNAEAGDMKYTVTWRYLPNGFTEVPGNFTAVREDLHTVTVTGQDYSTPGQGRGFSHGPVYSIHSDYELVLNPRTWQFDVYEDGTQLGVIQHHNGVGYGMDDLAGETLEDVENGSLKGPLDRVDVGALFEDPVGLPEEVGYILRAEEPGGRGVTIYSWTKENAVKILESITIS